MELWNKEFDSEITFSKYWSFDFRGDVINPKLGQIVFHVTMVLERWKSIVKKKFEVKYSFLKTTISNFWRFDSPWWHHQSKNSSKRSRLVFHVPKLLERWNTKVKGTLRWIIRLWKRSLKMLKFWLNVVTLSTQN